MEQTRLNKINEKIILNKASSEIEILVEAYNNMIDELGESAAKLAEVNVNKLGEKWQNKWRMKLKIR